MILIFITINVKHIRCLMTILTILRTLIPFNNFLTKSQAKELCITSTLQVQQLQARFDLDTSSISQNSRHKSYGYLAWSSMPS